MASMAFNVVLMSQTGEGQERHLLFFHQKLGELYGRNCRLADVRQCRA